MKRIVKATIAVLVCLFLMQTWAVASSHREAPLISNDPLADNTDVYAFRSPTNPDKVVLIANYIPFEHPAGGPNWYTFGEDIRYEIHVENNGTPGDDIIYRFTFKQTNEDPTTFFRIRLGKENWKTTYTLERSTNGGNSFTTIVNNGRVPPPNIGPRSIENPTVGLGVPSYESLMLSSITTASSGERVFAGPIDDPFFADLGGIFDLGNIRQGAAARDGLAKFNCHSLVLEVPIASLSKTGMPVSAAANILDPNYIIGVYASSSRRAITTFDQTTGKEMASGDWVQVSRLGMPLTNEVIIPIGDKDEWNFTRTNNEAKFEKYFVNPELALYMDDSKFGGAVPGFADLRIQSNSLGQFDFRNGRSGLYPLKGTSAVVGTALDDAVFGTYLLRQGAPRSVDLLPIFHTGVPNLRPYQLATGKNGNPLAAGKPFINNFLPTFGDMLRLNMAVPVTPRNSADFSSLGLVQAAVLGLTDPRFNANRNLEFIPNMDGFPNGRRLEDDVVRIELQAVSGIVLAAIGLWYDDFSGNGSPVTPQLVKVLSFTAGPTKNDTTFKASFPFVQTPWRGFNGPEVSGNGLNTGCSTPNTLLDNASIVLDASCGRNDGALTLVPTSGTGPFMYSINGGQSYVAGPASGYTFQNLAAGTYQLRIKDANGCESIVLTKTIRSTYGGPTFLNNQSIVLDASCGKNDGQISIIPTSGTAPFMYSIDGGLTYVAGPASGYTFMNLAAGTYQLRLKDARGCESQIVPKEVRPNVYGPCSTNRAVRPTQPAVIRTGMDREFTVRTYPNPSRGKFQLELKNISGDVQVQISTAKGLVVQQRSLNGTANNVVDFDLSGFAKGMYFIRVVSGNGTSVSKVIVQ